MIRALKSILMNFDCGGVRPKLLYVAKVGPPSIGTIVIVELLPGTITT